MTDLEFFTDPATGEAMYRKVGESSFRTVTQNDTDLIKYLLAKSEESYPEQYEALCQEYQRSAKNKAYYDFLRARRIVSCCFGEYDGTSGIDKFGNWNFKRVRCPLIAECKYYRIICLPKFNSALSDREIQVMESYFHHCSTEDIAAKLYLSMHTVNNHRKNALAKLNLHSLEEFQDFAHRTNMFK